MSETKHFAIFFPSFRGGGAERAMLLFAQGLVSFGYSVDVLVVQDEGPLRAFLPQGVRVISFDKAKVSFALLALCRYLRQAQPYALYSTVVNANLVAVIARSLSRAKVRLVIREANVTNPNGSVTLSRRLSGHLAFLVYRGADAIISVSHDVAKTLAAKNPALGRRIHVLPNPVISSQIMEMAKEEVVHPWLVEVKEVPLILGTGRLHPQKDFNTLIAAFAEVLKTRSARLLILGEGAERANLQRQVSELAIGHSVALPGYVENPFPYFKQASVFVLSSQYEGMPNVLLQAMSFGTPVVATDCHSGAPEVIRAANFGHLVPVGDVASMAQAIDSALAEARSVEAANYVARFYSVEHATREYLRVLEV